VCAPEGAALGVARHAWEEDPAPEQAATIARAEGVVVVADATLYYAAELRSALAQAGVEPTGGTAAELALAAYRAWGAAGLDRLEGDLALVLWDGPRRRLVCARDFGGKRPLYYARTRDGLLAASTIDALLAHPACSAELDPAMVASEAAGFYAACEATVYRSIRAVPAGGCVVFDAGEGTVATHRWRTHLEADPQAGALRIDDAAEALRALLSEATRQRVPEHEPTSIWLSGGWDSTAVYGAHHAARRSRTTGAPALRPVTLSYPVGDPGREDELVDLVTAHWGDRARFVPVDEVRLLDDDAAASARRRAEPFTHAFAGSNRSLARASRALGARVALDGVGGDQLFQVSPVLLADLLRTGRWGTMARVWRGAGLGRGGPRPVARDAWRWAVRPLLSEGIIETLGRVRGAPMPASHLERTLPPWFDPRFAHAHDLVERERAHGTPPRMRSRAQAETRWYLEHPFFPRAFGAVAEIALEEGMELRSPLFDRRIVRFALGRPPTERNTGRETKVLLRRAMQGLLPDEVLAPRPVRTGVSAPWFVRELRTTHGDWIEGILLGSLRLEDIGMIHAETLRSSWVRFRRAGGQELALQLFLTLQTELWLRSR
jgi:asparagine synthase (glutamine-hydrolysing)